MDLVWCDVDTQALAQNARALKSSLAPGARLGCVVKSNAYGHGLLVASKAFLKGGADWLIVQNLNEAETLREGGVGVPLLIIGYVPPGELERARSLACEMVIYDPEVVHAAGRLEPGTEIPLHIKIETGNNRQGLPLGEALDLARLIDATPNVRLGGASSHFANVEDTTDHTFARTQLTGFNAALKRLRTAGYPPPIAHIANSAATLLWPESHMDLVRTGIIAYGLWPSSETLLSTVLAGRRTIEVKPALTWKARIAQVKSVPEGAMIGYGCTYKVTHPSRIAILPVGYYEGYDRGFSNLAYVLIGGKRAPVRGRVCMNFIMVDVTDIPGTKPLDEAVLLGRQGDEMLTAETLASWIGSINYEVTTRISPHLPRRGV